MRHTGKLNYHINQLARKRWLRFWKFLAAYLMWWSIGGSSCLAQTAIRQPFEVLKAQHVSGKLSDTAFINALNRLGIACEDSQPDSVIWMQQQTIQMASSMGYVVGKAEAMRVLAIAMDGRRRYDEAQDLLEQALELARKTNDDALTSRILNNLGGIFIQKGNYPAALSRYYEALKLAEAGQDKIMVSTVLNNLANIFYFRGQYDQAEENYTRTLLLSQEMQDTVGIMYAFNNLGELYLETRNYQKALNYLEQALDMSRKTSNNEVLQASTISSALAYSGLDSTTKAISIFEEGIRLSERLGDKFYQSRALIGLGRLRYRLGQYDAARLLAEQGTQLADGIGQNQVTRDGHELLSEIFEASGQGMQALYHYKLYKRYADSLLNIESERKAATLQADYEFSKKELEFERKSIQQRWLLFSAFAAMVSVGLIALLINLNRRRIKRANRELSEKNQQIELQKATLEQTLSTLKATQDQLIQAEKMASLGEITSGIAHEIQNPLNFVNNFSEVSKELIEELSEEVEKGNYEEVKALAKDVVENLEKIHHHGKRADGIVKSMLFHSRAGSGKKEPTDLNGLVEEYLKLSYHGMRSRDKTFNAGYETSLDPGVGKVSLMQQDMGRVLLNLLNNAFYEVGQRHKEENGGFAPMVKVGTRRVDGRAEIWVEDNGRGIAPEILSKIFQPFFTTKPTGSGTGLGLSISYDIVTKGHGGELLVESVAGSYTRFVIRLPLFEGL